MDATSAAGQDVMASAAIDGQMAMKDDSTDPKDINTHNIETTVNTPDGQNEDPTAANGQMEVNISEGETKEVKALEEQTEESKAVQVDIPSETKTENSKPSDEQITEPKSSGEGTEEEELLNGQIEQSMANERSAESNTNNSVVGDHLSHAVPTSDLSHDWMCFECHTSRGTDPLAECTTCHRAYHSKCLRGKAISGKEFRCPICHINEEPEKSINVKDRSREDLNKCAELLINNLQLGYGMAQFEELAIDDKSTEAKERIHTAMDLSKIRHKAITGQYQWLREVVVDFKQYFHNFLAIHRERYSDIKELERKFNHEMKEVRLCVDCYKYSSDIIYDKHDNPHHWFLLVCDPPHELVFAKYERYPFWPAKVIEVRNDGKYDVRFFDAPVRPPLDFHV